MTASVPFSATVLAGSVAATAGVTVGTSLTGALAGGMVAWGSTLEPGAAAGAFEAVDVPYKTKLLVEPSVALTLTVAGLGRQQAPS